MQRTKTFLLAATMTLGAVAGVALTGAQAAGATTGNGYSGKAMYQITFSDTCNSVALCGADHLGGAWGWIALYRSGSGDGQITFCGHGAGGSGAGHEALDIGQWSVDGGYFLFQNASDPQFDGEIFPAKPGHYNLNAGPGDELQVTVALNPTA